MRKTVIALIIVLPMVFVLVLFSSLNSVSVSVPVSVSGIRIFLDGEVLPEGEAFVLDMADQSDHKITAQVEPLNAYEKGYTLSSDDPDVLKVSEDGVLTALGEGMVNVTAKSKDRGYEASVPVSVTSSKPYGVEFSLFDNEGNEIGLSYNASSQTYRPTSKLSVGSYGYKVKILGGDSDAYELALKSVRGVSDVSALQDTINKGDRSLLLPFSGESTFELKVKDAISNGMLNQTLTRTLSFDVAKVASDTGIVVNGVADGNTVLLAKGSTSATVYVECDGEPELTGEGVKSVVCAIHGKSRANDRKHKLQVTLEDGFEGDALDCTLVASGRSVPVKLSFSDFDFKLRSGIIKQVAGDYRSVMLKDTATSFYAVPAVELAGVEYVWTTNAAALTLKSAENGGSCEFNASENGEFEVLVQARLKGENLGAPKKLSLTVTTKIESILINNRTQVDLAERYTVGGKRFDERGELVENDGYFVELSVKKKGQGFEKNNYEDIEFSTSDASVAQVTVDGGKARLDMSGSGAITITARWKYNEDFGGNATQSIKLNVVEDAVEVGNYPELSKATERGLKVALKCDIMLGTYENGEVMPVNERQRVVAEHSYKSTYNTVFYDMDRTNHTPDEAYVMYAMEFKADVYGNGFNLNAEYFTNAVDAAGVPTIFRGPLVFVEYKAVASVAGQDNIAFLIRTDGVRLYGVNLLGCNDDSLYESDGKGNMVYQLNKLNKLGTTLEINADCEILNCRIRNGRNVVRVYGGNGDGKNYFSPFIINSELDARERIEVKIEGCVITQGREFLVKVGSNKAIQANNSNGQEPVLRNERGEAYGESKKTFNGKEYFTNNYDVGNFDKGSFFYSHYVMTDLTLRDSVLETSGLFCVGVESNFSGSLLYEGAATLTGDGATYAKITETWRKSGGTSYASVLRLEGDVRTYDWKDVSKVDSSTLIEPVGKGVLSELMKFDIAAMLKEVDGHEEYANLLYKTDGMNYVHGGIAFYGGGRNYSQIVLNLDGSLNELKHISINIGQFSGTSNAVVSRQAQLLPLAAGTHDFNFFMYTADGQNSYEKQLADTANGTKYDSVKKLPLFL